MASQTRGVEILQLVAQGDICRIYLSEGALNEYWALKERAERNEQNSAKAWRQLVKYFNRFCDHGHQKMLEEHFKSEGSYPMGNGKKVQIYAFKPHQWRLYGTVCNYQGFISFVGTKVDPSKKSNKADRAIMEAAAKALAQHL